MSSQQTDIKANRKVLEEWTQSDTEGPCPYWFFVMNINNFKAIATLILL